MALDINASIIIDEIADNVAFNGMTQTAKEQIRVILEDDSITDKTTDICTVLGVQNANVEYVRRALAVFNLE